LFEDRGTPQLRRHRGKLVADPDKRLVASPLGVLLAHRLIAPKEYSAGGRYRWLFTGGVRHVGILSLERPIGPGYVWVVTNYSGATIRAGFLAARAILKAVAATTAVENLVIYEPPPLDASQLLLIREGLHALYQHFESEARRSVRDTAEPTGGNLVPLHAGISGK
jgi:hypothetical protein